MSLNNTTNTEILLDTDIGHVMRLEIFAIIVKFVNTKKYNNQNLVATYTQISGESPKALLAERVGEGGEGFAPKTVPTLFNTGKQLWHANSHGAFHSYSARDTILER